MPPEATLKRRSRNRPRSSIGYRAVASRHPNRPSATTARANAARVSPAAQPRCGASMMAYTRAATPTMDSRAPATSTGRCSGLREVGTSRWPSTSASAASGTFTRKTDPHQKCSSSRPDPAGPRAAAPADTPAQVAIALPRSSVGNTLLMIDRVEGITKAAATPMTDRAAMTMPAESATTATAAPTRNSASPTCSAPLRP